jgi:hypothetical protein
VSLCLPLWTLLAAAATCAFGQQGAKWGRVQDNLQLGIEWSTESGASEKSGIALRVLLRNTGSERRRFPAGYDGSAGPMYDVKITAVREGEPGEQFVFDLNALKANNFTGIRISKTAHVEPGAAYVFTFPVRQLICVVDRKDVPLQALLTRGYSVRASLEGAGSKLVTPDLKPMNER